MSAFPVDDWIQRLVQMAAGGRCSTSEEDDCSTSEQTGGEFTDSGRAGHSASALHHRTDSDQRP